MSFRIKSLDIVTDFYRFRGPIWQWFGIIFFALYICHLLFGLNLFLVPDFFRNLASYAQVVIDKLGWPFEKIFETVRAIFKLPPPPAHWKPVVVCAVFIPARAIFIDFRMDPPRLAVGAATLLACIIIGVAGAYSIVFTKLSQDSPNILLLTVLVFSAIEFSRNTVLAYYNRKDATETYSSALRFYHGMNTLPNLLLGLIAYFFAYLINEGGIPGSWVLGLLLFLILHAGNMFLASVRVQARVHGTVSG